MKNSLLGFILWLFIAMMSVDTLKAQYLASFDREKLFDLYQAQKYSEAVEYLEKNPMEAVPGLLTYKQKAYAYLMAGQLEDAEKNYLQVLAHGENISTLNTLAQLNTKRGKYKQSVTYLERIIRLDSTHVNAYVQLADLALRDTTLNRLNNLAKANTLLPTDADIAYNYAQALQLIKQYEPAYKALHTAWLNDTANLNLLTAKIPLAYQLKYYPEVIQDGKRILLELSDNQVKKWMAQSFFNLKQYPQAIQLFQEIEQSGESAEVHYYYLSLAHRNIGKLNEATHYAKKTIEAAISPNISSYYLMWGGIYEMNKQYQLAESTYKKGLSYQALPELYFRLGILYDSYLAQKVKAVQQYKLYTQQKLDSSADKSQLEFAKERLKVLSPMK
ncbi:MAG: hypothetical protein EOO99_06910 [Pedobacter sp.]|nr:MAG: hypothetical protein EOO99_06910 [Pedobacter sp.]